uniref:NADH-ubiquinone oxidoreductase chain 2 n=1 Tax=Ascoschoengastia sp. TATW-1 TaxID=436354 RepID=B3IUM2_9ACAR|nr:NADH dehydrogenase subunit 2 [Ascoschoengastia sp. TATW-1]
MVKMMLITLLFSSPIMMSSMESWIMIWVLLEISSISFITIMKEKYKNDGILLYFLAQAVGSLMLLFSVIQNGMIMSGTIITGFMVTLGLMIKLGLIPFHQWYVLLGMEMELINLLMMMTIQKIAPLILMTWIMNNFNLLLFLLMSMSMALFIQMTQKFMKKLFIYSSIFQTSWVVMLMLLSSPLAMIYFCIYSVIMTMITYSMMNFSMEMMVEEKVSMVFMINMASLSGIPPLLGFIPKWVISKVMIKEEMLSPLLVIMMITSTISIFIYMRFFFKMWMKHKNQFKFNENLVPTMIIQLISPISLFMLM